MNIRPIYVFLWVLFLFAFPIHGFADQSYGFNCKDSKVQGSINYAVIGAYDFKFQDCTGTLTYDPVQDKVTSVKLDIKVQSIASNCQWCDRIVLSSRLLSAHQYPVIRYESDNIKSDQLGSFAQGKLEVRGIAQNFKSEFFIDSRIASTLFLKGSWMINRKDFKITWNPLLDHGGVIVGNYIRINWQVIATKT